MKRSLSLLLAVVLALGMLPVVARAADGDLTIKNGVLMSYSGPGGDVTIPNGVTSIGNNAFSQCTSLTSVTIPDSVTSINNFAFKDCTGLTSVTLPDSVTSIGQGAFARCASLTGITLPDGLTSMGYNVFSNCTGLTSITIPDGVTSLQDGSFSGCTGLTSVTIPSGMSNIGYNVFMGCTALTDVYYGGSEAQWKAISIYIRNEPLTEATIHYNSTGTQQDQEYFYDAPDPGASVTLPTEELERVTDPSTAVRAVQALVGQMTNEQKSSATGMDLAALYAETATAKAAKKAVDSNEVIINAAAVADLEALAKSTSSTVESALVDGGVSTARYLSNTVTLSTNATGKISIKIDPDILTTEVDKIRVETPTYALTLKTEDLKADLTEILTITTEDTGAGYAAGKANGKVVVSLNLPHGKTSNPVTLSLPTDKSNTTYQAVVNTSGKSTSSKYNPATVTMDGKITNSGSYTVQTNEKNFTDIQNKSAEMQAAIRYLASKGIINGKTSTTFDPDGSINRAEIAALLVRALGKLDNGATNSFVDVKSGDWYYAAAGSSQKNGLIKGYNDKTFRGLTTISKVQIVAVASRVLTTEMGYKAPADAAAYLNKYGDTVDKWAQGEVALATRENLVVYRTDGTFSGTGNMTRGDAAIIIYRLFQRIW